MLHKITLFFKDMQHKMQHKTIEIIYFVLKHIRKSNLLWSGIALGVISLYFLQENKAESD